MPDLECLKRCLEYWRLTDAVYSAFLRRWDLSLNAYFVIARLHDAPDGAEPARLAEALSVPRQLITIILRELERRRFVRSRSNKEDHRRKTVRLSASGQAFADEVCGAMQALDLAGIAAFSPAEQDAMTDQSRRFYESLRNAARTPRDS